MMNALEKIFEELEEATFQEDAPIYEGGMEVDGYVRASRVKEIIRSHMDEVSGMRGKRLIDANALDEEVRNFFLTIIGDPSQAMVVRECKESFRRIIDEQPTVYEANDWIPVEEKLPGSWRNSRSYSALIRMDRGLQFGLGYGGRKNIPCRRT